MLFISCNKADADSDQLSGTYIGYFHRNRSDTAHVSISFTDNSYQGESDVLQYPALCKGSFEQKENTITFHDSCMWSANFDWSLIVKGTYNLQQNDDGTIRIWRDHGDTEDEFIFGRTEK
jgi:hypothetical protein